MFIIILVVIATMPGESPTKFLNVMLNMTAICFWGLYATQVLALIATIMLFFSMSKDLKRNLICPSK